LRGELCYGRTSCDFFGLANSEEAPGASMFKAQGSLARPIGANARVAVDINVPRFWDIVYDTFALYGK